VGRLVPPTAVGVGKLEGCSVHTVSVHAMVPV